MTYGPTTFQERSVLSVLRFEAYSEIIQTPAETLKPTAATKHDISPTANKAYR